MTRRDFYVYLHHRADDGSVFYVGKGCGDRACLINSRGEWWSRVYKKHGRIISYAARSMPHDCALTLERILIHKYKASGHALVNITDGGGGICGLAHPSRKKVYSSLSEVFDSMLQATAHMRSIGFPRASVAAISKCANGSKHTAYGRAWSFDHAPDHPARVGNANRGQAAKVLASKPVETSCGLGFTSIKAAIRYLRINGFPKAAGVAVSECCTGKRMSAYGYRWNYPMVELQ